MTAVLLTLLAVVCRSHPAPLLAVYGGSGSSWKAYLFRGRELICQEKCDFLGNYVPAWRGFAGIYEGNLICISERGERVIKRVPGLASVDEPAFAVSPDGKDLAEFVVDSGRLTMVQISSGKAEWSTSAAELARRGMPVMVCDTPNNAIAFSQDGSLVAVTFALAGKPDDGMLRPPCAVVFSRRVGVPAFAGAGQVVAFDGSRVVRLHYALKESRGRYLAKVDRAVVPQGSAVAGDSSGVFVLGSTGAHKRLTFWPYGSATHETFVRSVALPASLLVVSFAVGAP